MKNVWLVYWIPTNVLNLEGVFSTRAKARAFAKKAHAGLVELYKIKSLQWTDHKSNWRIKKWEVDSCVQVWK